MLSFFRRGGDELEDAKRRLMRRLKSEIADDRAIRAMERVPRESFVPAESKHMAYEDVPVPIGEGQTISQPFIVALMVQALELRQTDKILELGTGSGYEAAVLAELANRVVTVERIASMADSARDRLAAMGYDNVEVVLAGERLGGGGAVRRHSRGGRRSQAGSRAHGPDGGRRQARYPRRLHAKPGADEGVQV